MCTVGYGDVYPTNYYEIMLLIVNMLIACGVFAHAVISLYMQKKKKNKFKA